MLSICWWSMPRGPDPASQLALLCEYYALISSYTSPKKNPGAAPDYAVQHE